MQVTPRQAVEMGWSIIPVKADKTPFFRWSQYQDVIPDCKTVSGWDATYRPAAWALVTGAISGRIVLDFDGEAGICTMQDLGLKPHVRTGSGYFHVHLEHPGHRVKTLNGKSKVVLGEHYPGLDIRADGGYVVFSGRNTAGEYEWLRDPKPDPLTVLPVELRTMLGLETRSVNDDHQESSRAGKRAGRLQKDYLLDQAIQLSGSGRNNAGFWLACQLRDNGYGPTEAGAVLCGFQAQVSVTNAKGQSEPYTASEAMAPLAQAYSVQPRGHLKPASDQRTHTSSAPDATGSGGLDSPKLVASPTVLLNQMLESVVELFHTPEGIGYALVEVDSAVRNIRIDSDELRNLVIHRHFKYTHTPPRT